MEALKRGPLVCDGAMGTMLMASGVEVRCPEEMNLVSPETVRNVHAAYIAAGADVVETNSFGGSSAKLGKAGMEDMVVKANRAAALLAREAAGESAFVAGSVGPLGEFLEPLGMLSREGAVEIFREQMGALAEGGVDFFLIETMYDLGETLAALEAARLVGLPAICTMTFDTHLHTMMGVTPSQAVAELRAAGALAVGANCGVGPEETLTAIREMHGIAPDAWLAAQPNAGVPSVEGGRTVYSVSAEGIAASVPGFLEAGVRLIGSCCGSSPDYTREIARVVRGG